MERSSAGLDSDRSESAGAVSDRLFGIVVLIVFLAVYWALRQTPHW